MSDQDIMQAATGSATNDNPVAPTQNTIDYTSALAAILGSLVQQGTTPSSTLNPSIDPIPQLRMMNAIMEESELPEPPAALIDGILSEHGKMLLTGASKTWKSFLAISLGIAITTGTEWLGVPCIQGKVVYANFEIGYAGFMRRVYEMADALGVDKGMVEQNFLIVDLPRQVPTMHQFVDGLMQNGDAEGCSLVIVDPLYKIYSGSENEQRDMAAFFAEVDRLIYQLECAAVIIHHQSKGFQGAKDIVDRACGSSVLGRDPDTIMTVGRINAPGNALRAEFAFRDFPNREPINYWFEYPMFRCDKKGELASCKYVNAHTSCSTPGERTAKRLLEIEDICEELMVGRDSFDRKELMVRLNGMKNDTANKYLDQSKRFRRESSGNKCTIYRRE